MSRRLLFFSLLAGCSAEAPAAPAPAPAPVVAELAPELPAAELEPGPLGVASCDAYVAGYQGCIDRVLAEDERPAHARVLAGQRLAWSRAKQTSAVDLEQACERARDAAKVALPRCSF